MEGVRGQRESVGAAPFIHHIITPIKQTNISDPLNLTCTPYITIWYMLAKYFLSRNVKCIAIRILGEYFV